MTTVAAAIRSAAGRLDEAGVGAPARDARRLMADALGKDLGRLAVHLHDRLDETTAATFQEGVARRAERVPLSHIVGYREFWTSRFRVTSAVLDPRPETEVLVAKALEEPFHKVLDLGTGSGAILISLLREQPLARGVGIDISPEAILIAGENAERLGVADRITLPISDWFDDVGGLYDLIVSNPPYIAAEEMPHLAPEVRDHEPTEALTDGADGLTAYRIIADRAAFNLAPGGRVLVEIGPTQGDAVVSLFRKAGFSDVSVHSDFDGRDRVVFARHVG